MLTSNGCATGMESWNTSCWSCYVAQRLAEGSQPDASKRRHGVRNVNFFNVIFPPANSHWGWHTADMLAPLVPPQPLPTTSPWLGKRTRGSAVVEPVKESLAPDRSDVSIPKRVVDLDPSEVIEIDRSEVIDLDPVLKPHHDPVCGQWGTHEASVREMHDRLERSLSEHPDWVSGFHTPGEGPSLKRRRELSRRIHVGPAI